jgi:AraC-like DNA-binding protein
LQRVARLLNRKLKYTEYKPSKSLQPYVKCYYTLEYENETIIQDQAFATGCIEVMFTLRGTQWQTRKGGAFTKTSTVELWGQILQPLSFRVSGRSEVFGIRFYPAAAAFLLKDDISRFNDAVVDVAGVVGNSIMDLRGKLQEAQSVSHQVELVEAYLIKKLLAHPKTIDKINLVRQIMNDLTQKDFFDNISNVATRYGITTRYLQKVFNQYTGLTPKLYTKINRFQNSLVLIGKNNLSLTDVAYECGYFDQSHFIREFKSFTGSTPSGFTVEGSTAILASPNK